LNYQIYRFQLAKKYL